jgi:glycosyltransferase involved in cell wall biosynthesis
VNIVIVHNRYKLPGGEDRVFEEEVRLLRSHGHQVATYEADNASIGGASMVRLALTSIWNHRTYRGLREIMRRHRADVLHIHNFLPLVSPSAHFAAEPEGAAVVQTLHNYRLACPNAQFFRQGRPCQECVGRTFPWPGVVHACYRGSRMATAAVAMVVTSHKLIGTWHQRVDRYIALTRFARDAMVRAGLPAEKVIVKPNSLGPEWDEYDEHAGHREGGLFVGRLAHEKGIEVLLDVWKDIDYPLTVIGDGPLRDALTAKALRKTRCVGQRDRLEIRDAMRQASFLVVPSLWYEAFPMVVLEAFSQGLPVIAPRHGAMSEIVEDRMTGLHYDPEDTTALTEAIRFAAAHPEELRRMGTIARRRYQSEYSSAANHLRLLSVYTQAIQGRKGRNVA